MNLLTSFCLILYETQVTRTGSMFSRFAQSAKSVMEESFLMITDKLIVEFKANRLSVGSGTGMCLPISLRASNKCKETNTALAIQLPHLNTQSHSQ